MASPHLLENIPGMNSWPGHLGTFLPCYRSLIVKIRVLFTSLDLFKTEGWRAETEEMDIRLAFRLRRHLPMDLPSHRADNMTVASLQDNEQGG